MYGHAERVRLAAQLATAETVEMLLNLPRLNEEQLQFVKEFAPERLRLRNCVREAASRCADSTHREGRHGAAEQALARRSA